MTEVKVEKKQKYSKSAFVDAAKDSKERLELKMLLKDDKTYTQDEVAKAVKAWKSKAIREEPEEVEA